MCVDCGCGLPGETTIDGIPADHQHTHHSHNHDHGHDHSHQHHQINEPHHESSKKIEIIQDILQRNNQIAIHNRQHLQTQNTYSMNWISAPGSGKTALLEKIIKDYGKELSISVIEGDQQTANDAERIRKAGASAIQINTGSACHLDANMIHEALHKIDLIKTDLLIIENVGNMVCPTAYDLGESIKLAVISTPEGEDKPVKYPDLLLTAKVLLINKTDLLSVLDFNLDDCINNAKKVNPSIRIFPVSAKTGEGIPDFVAWLKNQISS
ncbi:MAG: hydrogenase nickel incorporation protein HypB [Proteobacteria bacterium]|nr:hydrogenase nickel incorporation protein HypB [Pseudomonadota bacterium]